VNALHFASIYDIIAAKGRVKWEKKQMLSLLKQMFLGPFDERSAPGKPQAFQGSAHNLRNKRRRSFSCGGNEKYF